MFLGKAISNELDLDPSSYNEAISDKDSENWQSVMKVEIESITLILFGNLKSCLSMLNSLVVSGSIREKEDHMVQLRLLKLDW